MESKEFKEYASKEQLVDASFCPSVHENVGDIEVFNMHDVLTAVALLRQSKSTEGYAETALYTAEDTSCMLVG
eukprot:13834-Prymnesium_polylepis.1